MTPILLSQWVPHTADDFIGDANLVAHELARTVAEYKAAGCAPLKVLINGKPGIGKSALVTYLLRLLGTNTSWSLLKYNGTAINSEEVTKITRTAAYRDWYSDYRVFQIEEADMIPNVAQVRFLTSLDDLPPGNAVICTSNCKVKDFEERYQTRFQMFELEPPQTHQVGGLLRRWLTDESSIKQIAMGANGNVRAALLDAERALRLAA
jgi:replication-associated recombination protein RarA